MSACVEKSIWIAASPEAVFDLYVDGAQAKAWLGLDMTLEPFEGGRYSLDMELGGIVEGQVLAIDRPNHIHHTVSDMDDASGSEIKLQFAEEGGGTRVRLRHWELATEESAVYAGRTWDHHLARLAVVATGGAPGPDPMLRDFGRSDD